MILIDSLLVYKAIWIYKVVQKTTQIIEALLICLSGGISANKVCSMTCSNSDKPHTTTKHQAVHLWPLLGMTVLIVKSLMDPFYTKPFFPCPSHTVSCSSLSVTSWKMQNEKTFQILQDLSICENVYPNERFLDWSELNFTITIVWKLHLPSCCVQAPINYLAYKLLCFWNVLWSGKI